VISGKRSKVLGVAGGDDRAPESHRGGDDRRVDGVRGVQTISPEQSAGDSRRAAVELDNPIASTDNTIDPGVASSAPVDLHEHDGRDANASALTASLSITTNDATSSAASSGGPSLVRLLDAIERGRRVGDEAGIRRTQRLLEFG